MVILQHYKLKLKYIKSVNLKRLFHIIKNGKDQMIWLTAPLGLVRAKITNDQVQFYNKIDKHIMRVIMLFQNSRS